MDEEIWKDIKLIYGIQASNKGRIRNKHQVLSQSFYSDGYLRVAIYGKSYQAHRLVCMAFHGYEKDMEVNHKDKIRDNNKSDNLEWVTSSENKIHAHKTEIGDGTRSIAIYGTTRKSKSNNK